MHIMKIGIIGLGFLGGSMDRYCVDKSVVPFRYDKKGVGSVEEVNKADTVFVCVNTPYDPESGDIDLSYVRSAVSLLNGSKTIVLRSTIPPGTTDAFQKQYPEHSFLFNPEFLRARTAYEDFLKPPRQIIGITEQSKDKAQALLNFLPKAPTEYTKILPAKSAELIKYAANTMLAVKVALANKFYDFSESLGINYEEVKDLIGADHRIGQYGLDIFYEGFRGYNGTCFPKDVRTLISTGKKNGVDMRWLEALDDENLRLLRNQGIEPDYGKPKVI